MLRRALLVVAVLAIAVSAATQTVVGPASPTKRPAGGGGWPPVSPVSPPPADTIAPQLNITSPAVGPISGLSVAFNVNATDGGGSGVATVQFFWQYCPSSNCQAENLIGSDSTAPYGLTWTFPSCAAAGPEDLFHLDARATDVAGNVSETALTVVRLVDRGC